MQRQFLAALLAAVVGVLALAPAGASAATQEEVADAVHSATTWIRGQQNTTTGALEGFGGDWSMSALAKAGVSPAAVHGPAPGAPSLDDYFLSLWTSTPYTELTNPNFNQNPSEHTASDFAKIVLNTHAGGLEPSALAPNQNAVAQLAALYNKYGGAYGHEENLSETVFGALAMSAVGAPRGLLAMSAQYFREHQDTDGGWNWVAGPATNPSDVEITGATLAALCTTGATPADPAVARGIGFLESKFDPSTGAFAAPFGPNADTDAWALDGLLTCEVETGAAPWTTPVGKSPQDYLLSLQRTSGPNAGSFEYEAGEGEAFLNLYATQDALRALAGGSFIAYPPEFVAGPTVPGGTVVPLTLSVDSGYGDPSLCRVFAPTGSTVVEVLEAAETEAEGKYLPCVSGLTTNSEGVVTMLNGISNTATTHWVVSSSAAYEEPPAEQQVALGDFISLRFPRSGGLEATASSIDLGQEPEGSVGHGKSMFVRVREAPLEPRFSISGPQREDFLLAAGDCEGQQVEPGAGCTVVVRFAPTETGEASATLHLLSGSGPYGPPISLTGTGVAASTSHGPEGPAGPQGATGETGPSGAAGPAGPAGPVGAVGAKGDPGPRGPRGKSRRSASKGKAGRRKRLACKSRRGHASGRARKCTRRRVGRHSTIGG
jgi:hypothetical protein